MANILYRKQKQQKSLDNGVTWIDTGEYRVGAILENPSNCGSSDSKQCRWVELPESEGYYCDGYSKYTIQVEECTENGLIWTRTGNSKRGNTLIESNSTDCGYVKPDADDSVVVCSDTISFKWSGEKFIVRIWKVTSNKYIDYIARSGNSINNGDGTYTHTITFNNIDDIYQIVIGSLNSDSLLNIYSIIDTSNITDMSSMFGNYGIYYMNSLDLQCFDTSNVTDMSSMFNGRGNLTSLNLTSFDTSNVTDMSYMFYGCSGLTELDLSNFDTSNVTDMTGMFRDCVKLTSLDLTSFDISNVTDMVGMFRNCSGLISLDLSSFNTSNVTNMGSMFDGCGKLTTVVFTDIDTSNVTIMDRMFYNCSGLTSLDLSSFDTSNVTDMGSMFYACNGLTSLDLSNWNMTNVRTMVGMFYNCVNLTTIYCYGCNQTTIDILNNKKPSNCTLVY